MKFTFVIVSLVLSLTESSAQLMIPMNDDSLLRVLKNEKDTTAVKVLLQLAGSYFFEQPATSLKYAEAAGDSSKRLGYELGYIKSLVYAGEASRLVGDFIGALKMHYEANELSRKAGHKYWEVNSTGFIGMAYFGLQHFDQSIRYLRRALALGKASPPFQYEALYNVAIAGDYLQTKNYDSAFYFLKEAERKLVGDPGIVRWKMFYRLTLGDYYYLNGRQDSAYFFFKAALRSAPNNREVVFNHLSLTATKLSALFDLKNEFDSSLYFARLGYKVATKSELKPRILDASRQLAELHKQMGNLDSAIYYQDIAITVNDSIFGTEKTNELQLIQLEEQKRVLEVRQAEERYQNNIRLIGLISITVIILIASLLLFRSNRIKQKTNQVLHQTLKELKAAQSQLIQSEKMASLGELTAGIAHEIQNPLNFVNNFSEINKELIEELNQQARDGNLYEVQKLAENIKVNEDKIEQHGKRADAIVKSMLQHSRASSGQKELTDINALCDEYLRLAYHGFRAKDKSFNVSVNTNFDASLPKVNIIQHDMGRVVLNLINNAFYAVGVKSTEGLAEYVPTVKVSTKRISKTVEIKVEDNGGGIPDNLKSKIFQPFFTTKPAGQGTGLGLSLAYDIITKGHGGELKVATEQGKGSTFSITIPLAT